MPSTNREQNWERKTLFYLNGMHIETEKLASAVSGGVGDVNVVSGGTGGNGVTPVGTQGNLWNAATPSADTASSSVDTQFTVVVDFFGNVSGACTLTV